MNTYGYIFIIHSYIAAQGKLFWSYSLQDKETQIIIILLLIQINQHERPRFP